MYDAVIPPATLFPSIDETREQMGVYFQDQIKFGRFILTLNGRNDWVERNPAAGETVDDEEFTYRVGANYVFDNGFAPYIQAATSFQPVTGATFGGEPFEPTTGDQVEAGLKYDGRNLGRGVQLFGSLAAYEIVQKNVLTPDPVNLFFSVQEGEVEVKGVELEVVARIRERLTFNLAFTSIDTEITKTCGTDLGNEMVAVPDMLASALVDYTFQEGPLGGFGFGLGLRHRGEMFGDGANQFKSDSRDDVRRHPALRYGELAYRGERQQLHRRDLRRSMQQHVQLLLRDASPGHGQRHAQVLIAPAVKAARATLLILALALGGAARAQQPVAPLPFDHILRYDELTTLLQQWAERTPGSRRAREHRHDAEGPPDLVPHADEPGDRARCREAGARRRRQHARHRVGGRRRGAALRPQAARPATARTSA